jgi:hypothetical protein
MMKRVAAVAFALSLSAAAWAHNGMEHIMGTVASMTATSLDVKATTGKMTTVMTDGKTMWMRGAATIKPADVHTGDRVVIHAKKVDGKFVAAEVELGTAHAH